jgi:hypothetical protein
MQHCRHFSESAANFMALTRKVPVITNIKGISEKCRQESAGDRGT